MGTGSGKAFAHSEQGGGFEAMEPGAGAPITFITGSSLAYSGFNAKTSIIRIFATKDCFLAFGTGPIVTSSSYFLPGGIIDFIGVNGQQTLAVVGSTAGGILYLTEGG